MSATRTSTRPVAGPLFRRAASLPVDGTKARKVLCYLAACEDGGHASTVAEIARRTGVPKPAATKAERAVAVKVIDGVLGKLERQGWLSVTRRSGQLNHYELRLERDAR